MMGECFWLLRLLNSHATRPSHPFPALDLVHASCVTQISSMPAPSASKDIAKSIKTLLVMLQSMRDQQVTITLRNDNIVTGTIVSVDSDMNIELKQALLEPDPFYDTLKEKKPNRVVGDGASGSQTPQGPPKQPVTNVDNEPKDFLRISEDSREGYHDDNEETLSEDDQDDNDQDQDDIEPNQLLDFIVVKGTRVRHIDIPDHIDLFASTKLEIERIRNRRKQWTKKNIIHPNHLN